MVNSSLAPAPYAFYPSGNWLGNDGTWSTFVIHVGTPPQAFHVLPATNGLTAMIPIADDCVALAALNSSDCGPSRGVFAFHNAPSPGFQSNQSSTWKAIGLYELGWERNLGYSGNALAGFDTVGFDSIPSASDPSLQQLAVFAFATPEMWIGELGLAPKAIYLTDTEQPHSFLGSLKENRTIPSLSFGYTAGAPYRNAKVPGSLTLGGYDRSRMSTDNLSFALNNDEDRALTVGLQSIVATNSLNGTTTLTAGTEGFLALIDSSIPEIWLPRVLCDRFESAFGLEYDDDLHRYFINDTTRIKLQQLKPTLTFRIGTERMEGNTMTIQLPYAAFDLRASWPIIPNATNFFPIRRADNDSQYAIGRVFLQETYLTVDYERAAFNISQAVFEDPMLPQDIITIYPLNSSSNSTVAGSHHPHPHGLSSGVIAGIVIGCVGVLSSLAVLLFYLLRSRTTTRKIVQSEGEEMPPHTIGWGLLPVQEIMSSAIDELDAPHGCAELTPPGVVEIEGSGPPVHELPLGPFPEI